MPSNPRPTTGLVLGKFMPPHAGHLLLVEFARRRVDELTVVVGSLRSEPIPGTVRVAWMKHLFPGVRVVHLTDENPQLPHEHPDFWEIWRTSLLGVLPSPPDYVVAAEPYGDTLAKVLGARFIPAPGGRTVIPVSGTEIRADPMTHWRWIPRCVRPHFVKRLCVFGPESTGKSTLALRLARHLDTVCVPEYARTHLEARGGSCTFEDMEPIARGQVATEEALALEANRVLVTDTDVLATPLWSHSLFGRCPEWVTEQSLTRQADLYLVTDVDVPWIPDSVRYLPDERESFLQRCLETLETRGLPYVRVRGSWEDRWQTAKAAADRLVAGTPTLSSEP